MTKRFEPESVHILQLTIQFLTIMNVHKYEKGFECS